MSQFGVVIVATTSSALKAEKLLRTSGYKEQLIPTPREYSSDCGLAIRFNWFQQDEIKKLLADSGIDVIGIYHLD
ncbi:MAG: DUF3343 domain-containing protein [Chloroflexi bacterium]|nr:DUF3343 domain-containing protein [Chloroflexota bacterium]